MNFESTDREDRSMRKRILHVMANIDTAMQGRHVKEFTVTRTTDCKGYRSEHRGMVPSGPYATESPMIRIRVEFEVPDDTVASLRDLVRDLTEIESVGIRAAKEAKLEAVRAARDAAQSEVDRLEQELQREVGA